MLRTKIGPLELQSCVYNACCPLAMTLEQLKAIGASESGAILTKSVTYQNCEGNPEPRDIKNLSLTSTAYGSFNAEGLPNSGIEYCEYRVYSTNMHRNHLIIACRH